MEAAATPAARAQAKPSLPPLHSSDTDIVERPHLVWVVLDDVGYNDVGYASSDLGLVTPFLDDLSTDGIRFAQLYGQPVCTPSRAAMLTGKYPIHLQLQHWQVVPTEPWGLPTQEVLLPQYLRALGYKNVMIGKWHLGHFNNASTPRSRGFDHFYGFYSGGVDYFTHVSEESCDESVYHANNTCYYDFWDNESPQIGIGNNHQTGLLNERAISLIERHETSTPVFLFVALPIAHLPLQVPQVLYERHNETLAPFMNEDRRDFAALMLNADEAIANLTIALRRSKMYEKTMMVVLSDNGGLVSDMGGGSNYPLRGEKKYLYEGGVRVHGFIHSPMIRASMRGRTYPHMFHMVDWVPTILQGMLRRESSELESIFPQYSGIDGINHWHSLVDGLEGAPRSEMLLNIDYLDGVGDYLGYYRAALRVGDWKLVWNEKNISWYQPSTRPGEHIMSVKVSGRVTALYNVSSDPHEKFDLKAAYPGQMKKMLQKIQQKYLPTMLASNYRGIDPGCFIKWDQNHFVQPWVEDGSKGHSAQTTALQKIPARDLFETRFFDETTMQFSAAELAAERSDPEMARWIAYLGQLEKAPDGEYVEEVKPSPGKNLPKELLPGNSN